MVYNMEALERNQGTSDSSNQKRKMTPKQEIISGGAIYTVSDEETGSASKSINAEQVRSANNNNNNNNSSNKDRDDSVVSAMTDDPVEGPLPSALIAEKVEDTASHQSSADFVDYDVPKQVILDSDSNHAGAVSSKEKISFSEDRGETASEPPPDYNQTPLVVTTTPAMENVATAEDETVSLPERISKPMELTVRSAFTEVPERAVKESLEEDASSTSLDDYIRSPEIQNAIVERSPGGRYVRFMEKLGSGASKDVYRAYDTQEGIEVAWNVVNLSGVPKTERNRIVNEVRLLERLHHHNIISFHGSWVNRERQEVNFVTEILSSGTLKSFITKVQVIRWKIAKRWAMQILNGLEYLHSQDPPVIHRDLKCENIFINGTSGDLRIGDLGLSTVHRNGRVLSVLGTPEFMAPDMYEESSYDESVDVYAFGMCLLEIFTKEIPYSECKNPAQIYKKVSAGEPPEVLSRLQSKHARDFVCLCLGYKDENGKYVRPTVAELLTHPFFLNRENDDDEVVVEPPLRERTITEENSVASISTTPTPKRKNGGESMPRSKSAAVPQPSREMPKQMSSDNVSSRAESTPVQPRRARNTSLASSEDEDDGGDEDGDRFEEMQQSEINMRKVKVLMGRGQELKEAGQQNESNTDDRSVGLESQQPKSAVNTPTKPPISSQEQQITQSVVPQQQELQGQAVQNPPSGQASMMHYLVAAAVIQNENPNIRPYADEILKLVVTLPVDGQTQNVQFDFHLVEDDPVQVAKEMVQELGIPQGAVLEISETISGLARTARMRQEKYVNKIQNSQAQHIQAPFQQGITPGQHIHMQHQTSLPGGQHEQAQYQQTGAPSQHHLQIPGTNSQPNSQHDIAHYQQSLHPNQHSSQERPQFQQQGQSSQHQEPSQYQQQSQAVQNQDPVQFQPQSQPLQNQDPAQFQQQGQPIRQQEQPQFQQQGQPIRQQEPPQFQQQNQLVQSQDPSQYQQGQSLHPQDQSQFQPHSHQIQNQDPSNFQQQRSSAQYHQQTQPVQHQDPSQFQQQSLSSGQQDSSQYQVPSQTFQLGSHQDQAQFQTVMHMGSSQDLSKFQGQGKPVPHLQHQAVVQTGIPHQAPGTHQGQHAQQQASTSATQQHTHVQYQQHGLPAGMALQHQGPRPDDVEQAQRYQQQQGSQNIQQRQLGLQDDVRSQPGSSPNGPGQESNLFVPAQVSNSGANRDIQNQTQVPHHGSNQISLPPMPQQKPNSRQHSSGVEQMANQLQGPPSNYTQQTDQSSSQTEIPGQSQSHLSGATDASQQQYGNPPSPPASPRPPPYSAPPGQNLIGHALPPVSSSVSHGSTQSAPTNAQGLVHSGEQQQQQQQVTPQQQKPDSAASAVQSGTTDVSVPQRTMPSMKREELFEQEDLATVSNEQSAEVDSSLLDSDSEIDEELAAELRKLDEDFQKNLQRAKKVFDNRMGSLQRTQYEREAQHQKTLEKHEKERMEFEKRLAQEAEQQSRRIEQLQREWDKKRETVALHKRKQKNGNSISAQSAHDFQLSSASSNVSHARTSSMAMSDISMSPAVTMHKIPPDQETNAAGSGSNSER